MIRKIEWKIKEGFVVSGTEEENATKAQRHKGF
jgi:hypothetical protein